MHSTAQTAELTCPQCGRAFAAEIWLIVDAGERPDLLARARRRPARGDMPHVRRRGCLTRRC
ncbi:MAG: hypothetical protein IPM07_18510 [Anaerolineales bacterium]|nr:hypothetical protein [Anaerolineales bacterium]